MTLAGGLAALYALCALPISIGAALPVDRGLPPVVLLVSTGALAITLILLSTIDIRSWRLPDAVTLPMLVAGLVVHGLQDPATAGWHLVAAAAGFAALAGLARAYLAWRGQAGLGGGDAKLLAAGGAWLGLGPLPFVVALAAGGALVAVAAARAAGLALHAHSRIPFGPFIAFAIWISWLYATD